MPKTYQEITDEIKDLDCPIGKAKLQTIYQDILDFSNNVPPPSSWYKKGTVTFLNNFNAIGTFPISTTGDIIPGNFSTNSIGFPPEHEIVVNITLTTAIPQGYKVFPVLRTPFFNGIKEYPIVYIISNTDFRVFFKGLFGLDNTTTFLDVLIIPN